MHWHLSHIGVGYVYQRAPFAHEFVVQQFFRAHYRPYGYLRLVEPSENFGPRASAHEFLNDRINKIDMAQPGLVSTSTLVVHQIRPPDRKSTRLNSSHVKISYAVFC